jgi:iron-sulfur cluster assembly accessory protein
MNVTITDAAEKFIRRILRFGGGAGHGFRLVVSPGGCSGLSGEFTVESAPRDGDAVLPYKDMKLFLPAASRLLLSGVTIDFADTPTQTGLVFHDPNAAAGSCGSASTTSLPGVAAIPVGAIARRH